VNIGFGQDKKKDPFTPEKTVSVKVAKKREREIKL
jgi:hypothetical protein